MQVFYIFQIVHMVPNQTSIFFTFLFTYFDNPGIVLGYLLVVMFIMIPQSQLKLTFATKLFFCQKVALNVLLMIFFI